MVSANGAPTGSPAMAAVAEWVPLPWIITAGVNAIERAGQISVSKNLLENSFFSILKKKLLEKKYKSRTYIPLVHYKTVAKPQLLPSNMLYIVGRLLIRVDEYYS